MFYREAWKMFLPIAVSPPSIFAESTCPKRNTDMTSPARKSL